MSLRKRKKSKSVKKEKQLNRGRRKGGRGTNGRKQAQGRGMYYSLKKNGHNLQGNRQRGISVKKEEGKEGTRGR